MRVSGAGQRHDAPIDRHQRAIARRDDAVAADGDDEAALPVLAHREREECRHVVERDVFLAVDERDRQGAAAGGRDDADRRRALRHGKRGQQQSKQDSGGGSSAQESYNTATMRGALRFRVGVLVILLACSAPAYSHHSFARMYFESESVTIEGDVIEFQYRAPHAWLYVTVIDAQGQPQRYGAEWANPTRLERDGVTRDTFQPGDRVSITGRPGRDAERPADPPEAGDAVQPRRLELGGAAPALTAAAGGRAYFSPCSFLNAGHPAFICRNSSSDSQRRNGFVARSSAIVELGRTP